jgi:hypothetical protein
VPVILTVTGFNSGNNGKDEPDGADDPNQEKAYQEENQNETDSGRNSHRNVEIDSFFPVKIYKFGAFFLDLPDDERGYYAADYHKRTGDSTQVRNNGPGTAVGIAERWLS